MGLTRWPITRRQRRPRALPRITGPFGPFIGCTRSPGASISCAAGLPLRGDRLYPVLWPEPAPGAPPDYSHPLQLLAREIAFTDPLTGAPRCFTSRRRLQATQEAATPA